MTARENEREQEFGWGRGKWVAREKRPPGHAVALDNCEILSDFAVRDLRGAAILATVPGKDLRAGIRFLKRGGVTATVVIADDGTVWRIETGVPVAVPGALSASEFYSLAQAIDRLYVATGAAAGVLFDAGGGALQVSSIGLGAPSAPTIGSTSPSGPLAPPTGVVTTNAKLTAVSQDDLFLQHDRYGRTMERYNAITNVWSAIPDIPDGVAAAGTVYDTFYSPGLNAIVALWEAPNLAGGFVGDGAKYALFRLSSNSWVESGIAKDAQAGGSAELYISHGTEFSAPPAAWAGISAEPHGIAGLSFSGTFVYRLRGLSGTDLLFDPLVRAGRVGSGDDIGHASGGPFQFSPYPFIRTQINYSDTPGRIYYQLSGDTTESNLLPFLWYRHDAIHTIPNGSFSFADPVREANDGVPNADFNSYLNRGISDRYVHVLERIDPGPTPRFRRFDTIGGGWSDDVAPFTTIGRPAVSLSPSPRLIYHFSLVGTGFGLPFVRTAV